MQRKRHIGNDIVCLVFQVKYVIGKYTKIINKINKNTIEFNLIKTWILYTLDDIFFTIAIFFLHKMQSDKITKNLLSRQIKAKFKNAKTLRI